MERNEVLEDLRRLRRYRKEVDSLQGALDAILDTLRRRDSARLHSEARRLKQDVARAAKELAALEEHYIKAFTVLETRTRTMMLEHFICDYTIRELADRHNYSIDGVKKKIARGISLLANIPRK